MAVRRAQGKPVTTSSKVSAQESGSPSVPKVSLNVSQRASMRDSTMVNRTPDGPIYAARHDHT